MDSLTVRTMLSAIMIDLSATYYHVTTMIVIYNFSF